MSRCSCARGSSAGSGARHVRAYSARSSSTAPTSGPRSSVTSSLIRWSSERCHARCNVTPHGARSRPQEGIRGTIESSGLAMILIALTTGVGFGSLGSSRVPGIQNAGILVALGVIACLAATFLVLPALESLGRRRQKNSSQP